MKLPMKTPYARETDASRGWMLAIPPHRRGPHLGARRPGEPLRPLGADELVQHHRDVRADGRRRRARPALLASRAAPAAFEQRGCELSETRGGDAYGRSVFPLLNEG